VTDQPPEGRAAGLLNAAKTLSLANVLVIFLLALIAAPLYLLYKALSDEKILDRLMSTYEDLGSHGGCTLRHVQERGGPDLWSISSGFAFQGNERWHVAVILDHEPGDEMEAFCLSLKLIADAMLDGGGDPEIHGGPVPGAETDGRQHDRPVPAERPAETEATE
jgi:hypothetical protein